ncbi:MAG: rhomboid family intramembrane serine protease [Polyangiaceae bacterium]|nr:rhomboid family intramembrane serine protease [Polyangiaceae bacterium]
MLPIRDQNPTTLRPWVNYALLLANIAVFLWQMKEGRSDNLVVASYGIVPHRLLADPSGEVLTIFSSMFMHGGLEHIGGNLLFLYIFGDNLEDSLGHARYLAFYVLSGLAAAAAQIAIDPSSHAPIVGASGAIAGVLGGYLILFPRAPITVFFGFLFLEFPAWIVVGEFFLMNLFLGLGSLGPNSHGGVAFFSHIGGFVGGLLLLRPLLGARERPSAERWNGWKPPPRRPPPRDLGSNFPRPRDPNDPWN